MFTLLPPVDGLLEELDALTWEWTLVRDAPCFGCRVEVETLGGGSTPLVVAAAARAVEKSLLNLLLSDLSAFSLALPLSLSARSLSSLIFFKWAMTSGPRSISMALASHASRIHPTRHCMTLKRDACRPTTGETTPSEYPGVNVPKAQNLIVVRMK